MQSSSLNAAIPTALVCALLLGCADSPPPPAQSPAPASMPIAPFGCAVSPAPPPQTGEAIPPLLPGLSGLPTTPILPWLWGAQPAAGGPLAQGRAIPVAAATYWTNTGIELRAGQRATIHATGSWHMGPGSELHGAQGTDGMRDGCPFGSLVANIGIVSGGRVYCIGGQGEVVAERDGILYLGPNDGMLDDNVGAVMATLTTDGQRSTQLACGSVRHQAIHSSWVELNGWHTILALPSQQVVAQQGDADVALAIFDAWYASHRELAGAVPYNGQPIRFVPSPGIDRYGAWMFAGNPIRVDPRAADTFLQVREPNKEAWGFVHELGHLFSNINGGRYLVGGGPAEAWANVFSLYTLRRFGHPDGQRPHCDEAREYLQQGKPYAVLRDDPWIPLCMLMELQQRHGWTMYQRFFREYNQLDQNTVPERDVDDATSWTWVRDALNRAAGADVSPVLRKYRIPLRS